MRGHRRGLWAVQFSPVDQVIASASADGSIKLWSLTDYSCIKVNEAKIHRLISGGFLIFFFPVILNLKSFVAVLDAGRS